MDWSEQQKRFGPLTLGSPGGNNSNSGNSDWDRINAANAQAFQKPQPKQLTGGKRLIAATPALLAAAASLIPGVGTAAAAGLGGIGEGARQLLSGESLNIGKIGEEAALSAIPGGLGKVGKFAIGGGVKAARAAKLADDASVAARAGTGSATKSLTERAGQALERNGGEMMNSQTDLTRSAMRKIGGNAPDLYNGMAQKYGLSNIHDIADVAKNVTQTGGHATAVRNIVASGKGIDTSDIMSGLTKTLDTTGLSTAERKNVQDIISRQVQRMHAKDPLNPLGHAEDAFDVSKDLRTMASAHKDSFARSGNVADKFHAKVYNDAANKIENKLYSQEGLDGANLSGDFTKARDDLVSQYQKLAADAGTNTPQGKAYIAIAKEASTAKNVKDLRTQQKPWVTALKIDEKNAEAGGNAAKHVGMGGGNLVHRGLNAALKPVTVPAGKAMSRVGARMQGKELGVPGVELASDAAPAVDDLASAANRTFSGAKSGLVRYGVRGVAPQLGVRAVVNGVDGGQADASALDDPSLSADDPTLTDNGANGSAGTGSNPAADSATPSTNPFGREQLIHALQVDPKNADTYLALYKQSAAEDADAADNAEKGTKITSQQQKGMISADNAINTLDELEAAYKKAGGGKGRIGGLVASAQGRAGINSNVDSYDQLSEGAVTNIARALGETGTMTDQDIARAKKLIPKINDNQSVAAAKLKTLRNLIAKNRASAVENGQYIDENAELNQG